MRKNGKRLKEFFLPPADSPTYVRVLPFAILGILTLILLTAGAYGWEYTNSPQFCGATCHTMPPEYTAYLTSPHARIACVDCHIGKGFIATRITRKAGDLKHVFRTVFKDYEFPIRADELRPARETCELCHFPEKFSDDSLRVIRRYENDEENKPTDTYLILRTGGGSKRLGLGRGIHWHIENPVFYFPSDPEEQQIPYIKILNDDGTTTEYFDVETGLDPTSIDQSKLKQMDCITCHNRITHLVLPPEETVDRLIASNQVSPKIPEIHKKAVEVYSKLYDTTQEGLNGIAGLEDYYRNYHPDFYTANYELVRSAIIALQQAYGASVYSEQKSDWTTHPNNIGHKDTPGCFRCHDGKHLDAQQKAIRLECNLCHSVPMVSGPYDFTTKLEIIRGPEPLSHLNENWINLHNQVMDGTCQNCHTTDNAGGTSNKSFCSNSACHGNVWRYAGFDAPALRQIVQLQLPPTPTPAALPTGLPLTYTDIIGPLLQMRCVNCHGENGIKGLNMSTYENLMKGGETGPVILPGNSESSLLILKQSGAQPHFGQLTQDELQLIIDWIDAGAPK